MIFLGSTCPAERASDSARVTGVPMGLHGVVLKVGIHLHGLVISEHLSAGKPRLSSQI